MQELELHVTGMTCGACEERIQRALARIAGIARATADRRAARVRVVFDPGRTSAEAVQARIRQAGYQVVS